jgi:hypothetical protein
MVAPVLGCCPNTAPCGACRRCSGGPGPTSAFRGDSVGNPPVAPSGRARVAVVVAGTRESHLCCVPMSMIRTGGRSRELGHAGFVVTPEKKPL